MNLDEITNALNGKADNVELKAEAIELTIVGDMEKLTSKLKSDLKSALSIGDKAIKARDVAFSIIRKAYEDAKKAQDTLTGDFAKFENASLEAENLFSTAKKAATELGVDFKDVKGVKELEKTVSNFDDLIVDIKGDVTGILFNIPNI